MEHLLLKAATTATDEGTFTAVISTASVDRDKDIIEPAAMVASLAKWAALGKLVPLAWNHTDEVIGHIDPASAAVKDGEVIANGFVDQSIPRGEEAWRLVKSGTLSFSFGFLFDPKSGATKLPNGRYRVKELDIFEISTIPVGPANNDTRVLSFKRLASDVRTQLDQAAVERWGSGPDRWAYLDDYDPDKSFAIFSVSDPNGQRFIKLSYAATAVGDVELSGDEVEVVRTTTYREKGSKKSVEEAGKEPEKARSVDPLRKQAESVALEFASDGLSLRKPPRQVEQPKPEPEIPLQQLKQRMRDEILMHLSGEPL